jgi:hypothetical protein
MCTHVEFVNRVPRDFIPVASPPSRASRAFSSCFPALSAHEHTFRAEKVLVWRWWPISAPQTPTPAQVCSLGDGTVFQNRFQSVGRDERVD